MPSNMKKSKDEIQNEMVANRFLSFDQEKMIEIFDLKHDETNLYITFLDRDYTINRTTGEMFDGDRLASLDERAAVFELLTKSEHAPVLTGTWESIASLCSNTTDTSLGRYIDYLKPFGDDVKRMQETLLQMGAQPEKRGDVSAILTVFPNIPVWVQYWAADDEFPASIQFLFDGGILEHYRWSLLWNLMTVITDRMLETAGLQERS